MAYMDLYLRTTNREMSWSVLFSQHVRADVQGIPLALAESGDLSVYQDGDRILVNDRGTLIEFGNTGASGSVSAKASICDKSRRIIVSVYGVATVIQDMQCIAQFTDIYCMSFGGGSTERIVFSNIDGVSVGRFVDNDGVMEIQHIRTFEVAASECYMASDNNTIAYYTVDGMTIFRQRKVTGIGGSLKIMASLNFHIDECVLSPDAKTLFVAEYYESSNTSDVTIYRKAEGIFIPVSSVMKTSGRWLRMVPLSSDVLIVNRGDKTEVWNARADKIIGSTRQESLCFSGNRRKALNGRTGNIVSINVSQNDRAAEYIDTTVNWSMDWGENRIEAMAIDKDSRYIAVLDCHIEHRPDPGMPGRPSRDSLDNARRTLIVYEMEGMQRIVSADVSYGKNFKLQFTADGRALVVSYFCGDDENVTVESFVNVGGVFQSIGIIGSIHSAFHPVVSNTNPNEAAIYANTSFTGIKYYGTDGVLVFNIDWTTAEYTAEITRVYNVFLSRVPPENISIHYSECDRYIFVTSNSRATMVIERFDKDGNILEDMSFPLRMDLNIVSFTDNDTILVTQNAVEGLLFTKNLMDPTQQVTSIRDGTRMATWLDCVPVGPDIVCVKRTENSVLFISPKDCIMNIFRTENSGRKLLSNSSRNGTILIDNFGEDSHTLYCVTAKRAGLDSSDTVRSFELVN